MIRTTQLRSLTIIVSRGQSRAPQKRALETAVVEAAEQIADVRVLSIPHLYDLPPGGETIGTLRAIEGDIVFLSWVYPRAARWVLDRAGIRGHAGHVELGETSESSDEDDATDNPLDHVEREDRVIDSLTLPERRIYCIDLRDGEQASEFAEELRRIVSVHDSERPRDDAETHGAESNGAASNGAEPNGAESNGAESNGAGELRFRSPDDLSPPERIEPLRIDEGTTRRWYPVIDFSRCTNCMECIDFCLFGVYGVDGGDTILVEQPDNCRKGCPACSRVCPENAIIFPQHKTPAIAGAETDDGTGLKIDLSLLFGAPEKDEDPIAAAARERDEQLLLAGRAAVGVEVGIPKRRLEERSGPKDELDQLIDQLDGFDL